MRLVRSMAPSDAAEDVTVMVWKDDPRANDYARVMSDFPSHWNVWFCQERLCGEKLNAFFHGFPNADFYGFLSDDVQIGTSGMLVELKKEALAGKLAWPNDGVHGPRMATHPVAPGWFLRELGFWAHPEFPHNGLDTVLYYVAEACGFGCYRSDLRLIVRHPTATGNIEEDDETYRDARDMNNKAIDTMYRVQHEQLPHLVDKVRKAYGQRQNAD